MSTSSLQRLPPRVAYWTRKVKPVKGKRIIEKNPDIEEDSENSVAKSLLIRLRTSLERGPKLRNDIFKVFFQFAKSNRDMGARHFLKESLPAISYVNPNIPIRVQRTSQPSASTYLRIVFNDKTIKNVNVQKRHSTEILADFIKAAS